MKKSAEHKDMMKNFDHADKKKGEHKGEHTDHKMKDGKKHKKKHHKDM